MIIHPSSGIQNSRVKCGHWCTCLNHLHRVPRTVRRSSVFSLMLYNPWSCALWHYVILQMVTRTMKMKVIRSSKTLITTYKTTRHHSTEDHNWNIGMTVVKYKKPRGMELIVVFRLVAGCQCFRGASVTTYKTVQCYNPDNHNSNYFFCTGNTLLLLIKFLCRIIPCDMTESVWSTLSL
jgi:hypothetical protein